MTGKSDSIDKSWPVWHPYHHEQSPDQSFRTSRRDGQRDGGRQSRLHSLVSSIFTSLRLVRYATAITRHQQDAEDAVQAALLRLVAQPTMFAAAGQPWHYLLRIGPQ